VLIYGFGENANSLNLTLFKKRIVVKVETAEATLMYWRFRQTYDKRLTPLIDLAD
jgi:hypothetical protein